jgi:hypothetical protein
VSASSLTATVGDTQQLATLLQALVSQLAASQYAAANQLLDPNLTGTTTSALS